MCSPGRRRVYLVLNAPPEVVSTMSDPEGRRSLQDLLHGVPVRVFPVGRLEYHSMGLVFLTNDSDARRNRLFQTGHPVEKIKRVRVGSLELGSLQPGEHRTLSSEEIAALSRAIEGKLEPASEP